MNRFLLCFFITVSLFPPLLAQQQRTVSNVRSLTIEDGLPQGFLTGFAQDKQGFMWIATRDGLARYDGRSVKVFQHSEADSNTISMNVIRFLSIDQEDKLWIQYDNGAIDIMDPFTEKLRRLAKEKGFAAFTAPSFANSFSRIVQDSAGYLYRISYDQRFSTSEMRCVDEKLLTKKKIVFPPGESPCGLCSDKNNKVFASSLKALYVLDGGILKKLSDFSEDLKTGVKDFWRGMAGIMEVNEQGDILIVTPTALWKFNVEKGQWKKTSFATAIPDASEYRLISAPNGDVFLREDNKIYRINSDESLTLLWTNELKPGNIISMTVDRNNILWVGTNTFGARMIDLNVSGFTSYKRVSNFFYDVLPIPISVIKKYSNTPLNENERCFATIDKNGNLWINGFFYETIDGKTMSANSLVKIVGNHAVVYNIEPGKTDLRQWGIVKFVFDTENRCWGILPTSNRLFEVDLESKKFLSVYSLQNQGNPWPVFLTAHEDQLWILYTDAIISFNPATHVFKTFKDQPGLQAFRNTVLTMAVPDPIEKDVLWIGSLGNGMIRFDSKTATARSFTMNDGLPNNTVYAIVPDTKGYFWCSSNKGIFRFSPKDYSVLSFTAKDGLQGNEFNRTQFIHFPDGKIAFGGTEGITIFHPDSIKVDDYEPRVSLTDILINNEPLAKFAEWKDKAVPSIDTMRLIYDQNFLSFRFAGLEFTNPEKLQYRYMLTGIDKDWVNAGTQNSANYTNLAPGSYDLKINVTNTAGIWSPHGKTIHIIISPPWWETWWAYTFYLAAAVTIILTLFRVRLNEAKARQEIALKQKEAARLKAMDEIKSRFFSNITHEFRTPLSLILSPVEQMQQDASLSPVIKQGLGIVQRNARQLLRLINQLLDMSKLESGTMRLSLSRSNIHLFVQDCVNSFQQAAAGKNIHLLLEGDTPSQEYLFDTDKLEKILFNLLSNAIKFTSNGGEVIVHLAIDHDLVKGDQLVLRVADSGLGISEEKLPYIFDRFYQVDNSAARRYEGTGIGLALVKELAELLQGTVHASSQQGAGSVFVVSCPLQRAPTENVPQWQKTTKLSEAQSPVTGLPAKATEPANSTGPLVLIVEDNEELRNFIAQSLADKYRVSTAAHGEAALLRAAEELPDIIISDIMMPGMDGYTLCKEIKTGKATDHIAVILLSAKNAQESVVEGLHSGADDYITKPFHFAELELRVHNMIQRQEKLRNFYQSQLSSTTHSNSVPEEPHPFIAELYSILDQNLDDTSLTVEKLASAAAVSSKTLNRKLTSLVGLTANELIRQYRLKRSLEYLKQGINISQAAYSVGFESPAHFSNSFKTLFGVTPSEYVSTHTS
ncbi:MAG TPA: response regulator [Panacibacter sp.]|nr:response regulator [Panacibacter sp.]HNP46899.1 response regulator [Panacibacter sp.]